MTSDFNNIISVINVATPRVSETYFIDHMTTIKFRLDLSTNEFCIKVTSVLQPPHN